MALKTSGEYVERLMSGKASGGGFYVRLAEYALDHRQHIGARAHQQTAIFRGNPADGNRREVDLGTGPFRDTLATGAIESVTRRPATGWRKAFADEELQLRVPFGRKQEYLVPSRDPGALERALAGRRDD